MKIWDSVYISLSGSHPFCLLAVEVFFSPSYNPQVCCVWTVSFQGCWRWHLTWLLSRTNSCCCATFPDSWISPLPLVLLYLSSGCFFLTYHSPTTLGTSTWPWLGLTWLDLAVTCQGLTFGSQIALLPPWIETKPPKSPASQIAFASQIARASQIASMLPELDQVVLEIASIRLWSWSIPGFILVQLVLASISVSDLKGTHLHRQSVYLAYQ